MKKALAIMMALTLSAATATTAFAAELNDGTKDVTATYQPGSVSDTIYSVDVSWGSMAFTYTAPAQGTWNPETHEYDNPGITGNWTCDTDANKISVTNHSNAEVKVSLAYTAAAKYADVTGTFNKDTLNLANAVGTEVAAAPSAFAFLTMGGKLAESESAVTVGTVTVTLNK